MYDVIIIGGGPAGLSASVYAQRAKLKFAIIEKEFMGTGQIAESSCVDNYLGLFGESGWSLGEKFRNHAESVGTEFIEAEVIKISCENNNYRIQLDNGNFIDTKTIIYATGTYRRKLNIKGEEKFSENGISYCAVCDGAFYEGKDVAIIGGGDTALSDAIYLSKICRKVYIIHRRDSFRANEELQEIVKNISDIELILNAFPVEFTGEGTLNGIRYLQNNEEKFLEVSGSFTAIGSIPNSSLLKGIVNLDNNGYIIANENGITSAEGIFVAGDVRTKQLRQVITAVSDGANCIESVRHYLLNSR